MSTNALLSPKRKPVVKRCAWFFCQKPHTRPKAKYCSQACRDMAREAGQG